MAVSKLLNSLHFVDVKHSSIEGNFQTTVLFTTFLQGTSEV